MEEVQTSVADSLKYSKKDFSHPKYKLYNIYPLSGSQTLNGVNTGGDEIMFQLPVKVFNLSKSFINYTFVQSGLTSVNDTTFYNHKTPLAGIRQIQLYTQYGVYLCDIYNVNKFLNVAFFAETSINEFKSNDYENFNAISKYGMYCSTSYADGTTITQGNYSQRITTDNTGAIQAPAAGAYAVPQIERQYLDNGVRNAGAPGSAITVNIQFPMKYIVDSIFSVDKDLYFGEILQLRIVTDSINNVCFQANYNDISTNMIAITRNLNYSNLSFYLAVEQDLNIANQIISKVNTEGLQIAIPYVYSYKLSLPQATNHTISLRFNRAHGKKLRRIYHAPNHTTDANVYAYCRDNLGGLNSVSTVYTLLNNERLQEYNADCTKAQDYMTLRNKLSGTTYINLDNYQNNWFWVDDFTTENSLASREAHDINLSSGIPLDSEQKWDIYMTTANRAFAHYDFAVTEKEVSIKPGSIIVS